MRDKNTQQAQFVRFADRLCRLLAEEGLALLCQEKAVETPCGNYSGFALEDEENVSAVSILRSGDILLEAVRAVLPSVKVGKILIQRDENDPEKNCRLYYSKLPKCIKRCKVLLCDPMLATGGSAIQAVKVLLDAGVEQNSVTFINCICCPEGLEKFHSVYPDVRILTGVIDETLNSEKYIVPGLGDFGDRYYGTLIP